MGKLGWKLIFISKKDRIILKFIRYLEKKRAFFALVKVFLGLLYEKLF